MRRTIMIFLGLAVLLGGGVAIAAWRQPTVPAPAQLSAQQLKAAYARIRPGITPVSQLGVLGFKTEAAVRLSYLGVVAQLMPADSHGFDTLDPAVQSCLEAQGACTAYVFSAPHPSSARVVLLIQGGRVAFKVISGFEHTSSAACSASLSGLQRVNMPMLRASLD